VTTPPPTARGALLDALALSLTTLVVDVGTLSSRYTYDGILFSFQLENARATGRVGQGWHPHHLLFEAMALWFTRALELVGLAWTALFTLQLFCTLWGAITVFCFALVCRRLTQDRALTVLCSTALMVSYGFWFFSVDPEVYVPEMAAVVITLLVLVHRMERGPSTRWPLHAVFYGVLGAFLMSNHLSAGALLLPLCTVAAWFLRDGDGINVRTRLLRGLLPGAITAVVALGLMAAFYVYAYSEVTNAHDVTLTRWVFNTAAVGAGQRDSFWNFSPAQMLAAAQGYAGTLAASGAQQMEGGLLLETLRVAALLGVTACVLVYFIFLRTLWRKDARWPALLLMSYLPLLLFNVVWDSPNFEAKVVLLAPLWVMVACGLRALKTGLQRPWLVDGAAALLVLLLGSYNLLAGLLPGSQPERNADLQRAHFVRDNTEENAVIYIGATPSGFNNGKIYLLYFASRQPWAADLLLGRGMFPLPFNAAREKDGARPRYVLSEVVEPGTPLRELATRHQVGEQQLVGWFADQEPRLVARMPDGFGLYRLTR